MSKERPIIFSGEMINAILAGNKTMTRRVVKPQPPEGFRAWHGCVNGNAAWTDHPTHGEKGHIINAKCPYGIPGDKLWVRETFATHNIGGENHIVYRADSGTAGDGAPWKPSIFMPRWASRITLEVVSVRVERLQEISKADICAELGCSPEWPGPGPEPYRRNLRSAFCGLWDTINGKRGYPWDSNPYAWVVEFKRI